MQGDCIIVTGGARGIGKAIALVLARAGFDIALNYAHSEKEAQALAAGIEAMGRRAAAIQADISDFDQAKFLISQTKEYFGNVYGLVNNAGITKDGMLMRMGRDDIDKVLQTNLSGALYMMRHASGVMLKNRRGRIVNIASVAGVMGNAGQANYSAAKAGMIGLSKAAARELAPRNITVNAVAPGLIETDMTAAMPEKERESMTAAVPLSRMGSVEEVAALVGFLFSEQAAYITGQCICIDGGLAM